jgi:hypothetical protein
MIGSEISLAHRFFPEVRWLHFFTSKTKKKKMVPDLPRDMWNLIFTLRTSLMAHDFITYESSFHDREILSANFICSNRIQTLVRAKRFVHEPSLQRFVEEAVLCHHMWAIYNCPAVSTRVQPTMSQPARFDRQIVRIWRRANYQSAA